MNWKKQKPTRIKQKTEAQFKHHQHLLSLYCVLSTSHTKMNNTVQALWSSPSDRGKSFIICLLSNKCFNKGKHTQESHSTFPRNDSWKQMTSQLSSEGQQETSYFTDYIPLSKRRAIRFFSQQKRRNTNYVPYIVLRVGDAFKLQLSTSSLGITGTQQSTSPTQIPNSSFISTYSQFTNCRSSQSQHHPRIKQNFQLPFYKTVSNFAQITKSRW